MGKADAQSFAVRIAQTAAEQANTYAGAYFSLSHSFFPLIVAHTIYWDTCRNLTPQNTDRAERSRKDAIAQVAIWEAQDVARQVISFCDDIKDQAERAERKAEKLYVVFERWWHVSTMA